MRTIYAFGRSNDGAFIDFEDQPSAVVVTPDDHTVLIVASLEEGTFQGAIPGKAIDGFYLVPAETSDGGWLLIIRYKHASGTTRTLPIGTWSQRYRDIRDWVDRLNYERAHSDKSASGEPRKDLATARRVAFKQELNVMGGISLSLAKGSRNTPYWQSWMDIFAGAVGKIVEDRYGCGPVKLSRHVWPEHQTWNMVFERLRIDNSRLMKDIARIELCFEFLYLSEDRQSKYDIVSFGSLRNGTVLFHQDNTTLRSQIDWKNQKPLEFYEWFRKLRDASADLEGSAQSVVTSVSTVSDAACEYLISLGLWADNDHRRFELIDELVNELSLNKNTTFIFCDTVIAADISVRWRQLKKSGTLFDRKLAYPQPVLVGLAYDKRDSDWGEILHTALGRTLLSTDPQVRASWHATMVDLEKIGVVLEATALMTEESA